MEQKKWNLGDIRPPKNERTPKRTIQRSVKTPSQSKAEIEEEGRAEKSVRRKKRVSRSAPIRRLILSGGAVLALVALVFITSFFWRDAELIVYPQFKDVVVQAVFTADMNPESGELGYTLLEIEEIGERIIPATGSEDVEEQAFGTVTIFNTFSKNSQRLVKNTRLESPDGLIFKISESAVIPGYTENSSGERVPGSVSAKVFAESSGEKYNIAPTRFTIPGLEGSDQFDGTYAESEEQMRGGFVGEKLIVDDKTLTETKENMHAELKTMLLERLSSERPAGFELYEESIKVTFESLPSVDAGGNNATIREKGILSVPIFENNKLASYIARNTIAEYDSQLVRVENAQSLSFTYVEKEEGEELSSDQIEFNLSGNARIVWDYDETKLREDIAGVSKKDLTSVLSKYPAIPRAETVIKPFWKQSFPDSPLKIKITEILEAQ